MYFDSIARDFGGDVSPLEIFQQYWAKWLS